jgi:DNA-damage-inducible protein D
MSETAGQEAESSPGAHVSPFEAIKQVSPEGQEYWSARDLASLLDYASWQRFYGVVERAEIACANSGQRVSDHFLHTHRTIEHGKGGKRKVVDVHLSRYACYLLIQNADPSKEIVALGQTYFAVQTRRQERADELAGLTESQKRLFLRGQLSESNLKPATAARDAGVIVARDFGIFQDHGYRGLYGGLRERDIHARKELKKGQHILDHMGSTELAANLFRATQAEEILRREQVQGKEAANRTHYEVGQAVRRTIVEIGGTLPEDLPTPEKSVQQLRKEHEQRRALERQPALFEEVVPDE